jgi:hypothetical protein
VGSAPKLKCTQHYGKSPDQIGDEELRQYFLYLTHEKKASRSTITIIYRVEKESKESFKVKKINFVL